MSKQSAALAILKASGNFQELSSNEKTHLFNETIEQIDFLAKSKIDGLCLACKENDAGKRLYKKIWDTQKKGAQLVIDALFRSGISTVVFKGAEVSRAYFDANPLSIMGDIDFLFNEGEIVEVIGVLYRNGFSPAQFCESSQKIKNRTLQNIALTMLNHYELPGFCKMIPIELEQDELSIARRIEAHPVRVVNDQAYLILSIDCHHKVSTDISLDYFSSRLVSSSFCSALTFCPEDHLWLTLSRFYNEVALNGKNGLRDFAYVMPILKIKNLDWDLILAANREFSLYSILFYYLKFVTGLAMLDIGEILESINPQKSKRFKDFGWQLSKLFESIDECPIKY